MPPVLRFPLEISASLPHTHQTQPRQSPSCSRWSLMGKACVFIMAVVGSCAMGVTSCFVIFTPGQSCPSVAASSPAVAVRATICKRHHHHLQAKKKKSDRGRPSLDDVERLSRGQAAKKRGTGSRGVCHRLNESERKVLYMCFVEVYMVGKTALPCLVYASLSFSHVK